jgi:uncharacterized protein (DUF2141 family)
MLTQIRGKDAILSFQILNRNYAIAVIHDENRNGELDTNMFGIKKVMVFPVVQRSQ